MVMLRLILILVTLSSSLPSFADNLHIDSEELVLDKKTNTASFTGNVMLCFKDMKLISQKVVFYFEDGKNKKIKKIVFPTLVQVEKLDSTILADSAVYTEVSKLLVLTGHVVVEKNGEVIVTDEMLYHGKLEDVVLK